MAHQHVREGTRSRHNNFIKVATVATECERVKSADGFNETVQPEEVLTACVHFDHYAAYQRLEIEYAFG